MSKQDNSGPMGITLWVANDNDPVDEQAVRDVFARQRRAYKPVFAKPVPVPELERKKRVEKKQSQLVPALPFMAFALLMATALMTLAHPMFRATPVYHLAALFGFTSGMGGLAALWYKVRPFMADITTCLVGFGFASLLVALKVYFNIAIGAQALIALITFGFWGLANTGRSKSALGISILCGLLWGASAFFLEAAPLAIWGFPILWLLQMMTASRLESGLMFNTIALSGLAWLGGTLSVATGNGHISAAMAIAALFSFAALLILAGRNMKQDGVFGALSLTLWGAAVAAASGLMATDSLLASKQAPWAFANTSVAGELMWGAALTIGAIVTCILLIRSARFFRMSLFQALGLTALLAVLPVIALNMNEVYAAISALPSTASFAPAIIFGLSLCLVFALVMNRGLTYRSWAVKIIGFAGLCGLISLAFTHVWQAPSNLVAFGIISVLCILAAALWTEPLEPAS